VASEESNQSVNDDLAKQFKYWLRSEGRLALDDDLDFAKHPHRRPIPEEAETLAEMLASHFQPVTSEEVVERVRRQLKIRRATWIKAALEALGPAYVVKEQG
jgi:hypothetical protein